MKRPAKPIQLSEYRKNYKMKNFFFKAIFYFLIFSLPITYYLLPTNLFAQNSDDLEITLDVKSNTIALPGIFKPNMDLSGRGSYAQASWPQTLAAPEVLDTWQKDIGFNGIFRIQYNLWDIYELAKNKEEQDRLLANYEEIIKKISDAGGIVILDIFGTPAGLGKVLDKKSPFYDYRSFKELVKSHMKNLSCDKRYNLWYEVWTAPDLDDFFLGRKQEYFNLYKAVAEGAKELEAETRIHIPVGGPGVSWWFQNSDGNTIVTPEKSFIYEFIKFCYSSRLPIDFITWHAYSTDGKAEKELTRYNKTAVPMIRDWLNYFRFDRNTPLIIDEWNYDSGANVLPARGERAFVSSSFIVSRIKNMYDAGLDHQVYFSLEDFYSAKDNLVRNTGVFWFDPESQKYKGGAKSSYNVFRMLAALGNKMFFTLKFDDEFVGVIPTKTTDGVVLMIYNYIDPALAFNYVSRNIARLNEREKRFILSLIKRDTFDKIMRREQEVSVLRCSKKVKTLLQKAQEIYSRGEKFKTTPRNIKISLKNLKDNYLYQRYAVDEACSLNCAFTPAEEKETTASAEAYQESLVLKPYSVNMVVLKKKAAQEAN